MKRVFNLLVVDESGSMEIIRKQALVASTKPLRQSARYRRRTVNLSSA